MAKFFINRPIVAIVIAIITVTGGVVAMVFGMSFLFVFLILAATLLGVFLVPVLYVAVERIAGKEKKEAVKVPGAPALEGGHD